MANYMLVRHKVKNFDAWKVGYDADRARRAEAGVAEKYVLQGDDGNSNEVVVLFEAKDLKKAKSFAESTDLRKTMERAGVTGKPDIYYLHD